MCVLGFRLIPKRHSAREAIRNQYLFLAGVVPINSPVARNCPELWLLVRRRAHAKLCIISAAQAAKVPQGIFCTYSRAWLVLWPQGAYMGVPQIRINKHRHHMIVYIFLLNYFLKVIQQNAPPCPRIVRNTHIFAPITSSYVITLQIASALLHALKHCTQLMHPSRTCFIHKPVLTTALVQQHIDGAPATISLRMGQAAQFKR